MAGISLPLLYDRNWNVTHLVNNSTNEFIELIAAWVPLSTALSSLEERNILTTTKKNRADIMKKEKTQDFLYHRKGTAEINLQKS